MTTTAEPIEQKCPDCGGRLVDGIHETEFSPCILIGEEFRVEFERHERGES